MDSELHTQPEYVGHTAKDASTGSRLEQAVPIDAALVAQRQKDSTTFDVDEDGLKELRKLCVEKMRGAAKSGVLKSHPQMLALLYRWRAWATPEEPLGWVEQLVDTDDGLLAFLKACTQRSSAYGMHDYALRLYWAINLKDIENFIPIDVLVTRIARLSLERLEDKEHNAIHAFQRSTSVYSRNRSGISQQLSHASDAHRRCTPCRICIVLQNGFLLTWHCNHLANANKKQHIRIINARMNLLTPEIVTPLELFTETSDDD